MVAATVGSPHSRGRLAFLLTSTNLLLAFAILYWLLGVESPGIVREPEQSLTPVAPEESSTRPVLSLSKDGLFKIAIFADLHYGEEEHGWGPEQDVRSTKVMRSVLKDEKPDLVVVNGDLITGENTMRENASNYVHQVFAPMVEAGTPWASTYGNHDSKFNLSREATYAIEKNYTLSYTNRTDPSLPGITNYYLLIFDKPAGKPAAILWFFDSRGGGLYQDASSIDDDNIPNWVADEVVSWFVATNIQLKQSYGSLPSLVFVHIPPHVFLSTQEAGLGSSNFPGINDDVPVSIQGDGLDDQKLVDAMLATELVHSIHVGHDHGNSWCGLWPVDHGRASDVRSHAPFLCFGKHTGYGGYGEWRRGSRIVSLRFVDHDGDGDFDDADEFAVNTWVRMEDSDIVTSVSLNETYGTDEYPTYTGE